MRDRIEINKSLVPYTFNILLGDQWWELYVNYNETGDLFTVSLFKDGVLICTEPIVYGVPLFKDMFQPGKYPALDIVPLDESGQEKEVKFSNFNELIFLTIDDEGEDSDG